MSLGEKKRQARYGDLGGDRFFFIFCKYTLRSSPSSYLLRKERKRCRTLGFCYLLLGCKEMKISVAVLLL